VSHVLRIGAVGWHHREWVGGFYPDTLPEDWWLTYYSNEFDCVLVPAEHWRGADARQWCDDTPEAFRFYLELREGSDRDVAGLTALADALGARLGGVLARRGAALEPLRRLAGRLALFGEEPGEGRGCCWRPGGATRGCTLGIADTAALSDRRALSACIQEFAAQVDVQQGAALLFDGTPPAAGMLRDAVVVAGLLGL